MEQPIETIQMRHGVRVKIFVDPDPMDPRENDNLGIMVCWHPRHNLGDKHDYKQPRDFLEALAYELRQQVEPNFDPDGEGLETIFQEATNEDLLNLIHYHPGMSPMLPLYLYDHSGITMRTGPFHEDPGGWDSGQVGWTYITKDKLKAEGLDDRTVEQTIASLDAEVEEYAQYLEGDVYGYEIDCPAGDNVDSCWNFYGLDYARSEAKAAAAHFEAKFAPESLAKAKVIARVFTSDGAAPSSRDYDGLVSALLDDVAKRIAKARTDVHKDGKTREVTVELRIEDE